MLRITDLTPGQLFILCQTGELYVFLGSKFTARKRKRHMARPIGSNAVRAINGACHVRLFEQWPPTASATPPPQPAQPTGPAGFLCTHHGN